ncbi:RNA-binding protein with KH domain [Thermolongibacillus altinsuensis]|jgi:predicted RNA-binding protein YlqC (UPF0109 family)|uniref:RNA-binding protein KhpA n=1 Tax=Thermolongibacillus altinsuensis TaxID=575256 RepID=A0A4V2QAC5_9BACL|nr:KH domain-containing protein [Thermolongibacillus altinsuensis]TCL50347.1 RNA-binding protein with KH domain [Thermolongibacillus altinsuensis]GMB08485.1 UPF0109 protein [Thermolongibacillus altinsuensis]
MKALIETIVRSLVDRPECVVVREVTEGKTLTYILSVHHEDMGKVIGKNGRIIHAIRAVAQAAAKQSKRVEVRVEE